MARATIPSVSDFEARKSSWANKVKGNDEDHESRILTLEGFVKRTAPIALTNAQIKELPSTAAVLLAALGSNIRGKYVGTTLRINSTSGAYTNISAGAYIVVATPGEAVTLSCYFGDNASPALTQFSDIFAAADDIVVDFVPYSKHTATGFGVVPQSTTTVGGVTNKATHLIVSNSGGDLTGGHASNFGSCIHYYIPETLS